MSPSKLHMRVCCGTKETMHVLIKCWHQVTTPKMVAATVIIIIIIMTIFAYPHPVLGSELSEGRHGVSFIFVAQGLPGI